MVNQSHVDIEAPNLTLGQVYDFYQHAIHVGRQFMNVYHLNAQGTAPNMGHVMYQRGGVRQYTVIVNGTPYSWQPFMPLPIADVPAGLVGASKTSRFGSDGSASRRDRHFTLSNGVLHLVAPSTKTLEKMVNTLNAVQGRI